MSWFCVRGRHVVNLHSLQMRSVSIERLDVLPKTDGFQDSFPANHPRRSDLLEKHRPFFQNGGITGRRVMVDDGNSLGKTQRPSLGREIAWLLAFKAIALILLYFAFFGPSHRIRVTPSQVAAALVGSAQINERP